MDLLFNTYDSQKTASRLQVIVFLKLINCINIYYIDTGWDYQNQLSNHLVFKIIVKYRVIAHAVLKYAEKITIAFLISIHTETLSAMMKNK